MLPCKPSGPACSRALIALGWRGLRSLLRCSPQHTAPARGPGQRQVDDSRRRFAGCAQLLGEPQHPSREVQAPGWACCSCAWCSRRRASSCPEMRSSRLGALASRASSRPTMACPMRPLPSSNGSMTARFRRAERQPLRDRRLHRRRVCNALAVQREQQAEVVRRQGPGCHSRGAAQPLPVGGVDVETVVARCRASAQMRLEKGSSAAAAVGLGVVLTEVFGSSKPGTEPGAVWAKPWSTRQLAFSKRASLLMLSSTWRTTASRSA